MQCRAFSLILLFVLGLFLSTQNSLAWQEEVDLAIGSGSWAGRFEPINPDVPPPKDNIQGSRFGRRPAVLVAWRNSNQIENIEVLVRNLGESPATGRLTIDFIDARNGRILASRPGEDEVLKIDLPPASEGGREGRIYNMIASRKINNLLDTLDRERHPYLIRAHVISDQPDLDPTNNTATKSYFTATRATANAHHYREFYFSNTFEQSVEFKLLLQTSELPDNWQYNVQPELGQTLRLRPGEIMQGIISVATPPRVREAEHLVFLVSGIHPETREVIFQDEWFIDVDNEPPRILSRDLFYEAETNMIVSEVIAEDLNSGIMEASGTKLEFTTHADIFMVASVAHNYNLGDFMTATSFTSRMGPFEPGSRVLARVTILDTVGNATHSEVSVIHIPEDAKSVMLPPVPVSPFLDEGGDVFVPTFEDPQRTDVTTDIEHLGVEVTVPRSVKVGEVFTFDVAATFRNNGPLGPVDVVWQKRLTEVPPDCEVNQREFTEVVPNIEVGQKVTRNLTSMPPEVVCSEPGIHIFAFADAYTLSGRRAIDIEPENNVIFESFNVEVRE